MGLINMASNSGAIMSRRSWNQMSTDERLEVLREDIARACNVLNRLVGEVSNNHSRMNEIEPKLREVTKAVESLARRLPRAA